METAQQQSESPPASDTAVSDLQRELDRKRDELGIVPSEGEPIDRLTALRMKMLSEIASRPKTPEQIAEKASADERRKVYESRERIHSLVQQAGDRYAACRLATYVVKTDAQARVVQAVKDYTSRQNLNEGLILYGPCGTGKDHLAFAVAGQAVWNGATGVWMYGQDWFGQVRDAMDGDTTEERLVRRLCDPDVAVISDPLPPIGNLTVHQATMLYRVVQGRYQSGKPTIVTVNVASDADADERMGAPTWDRLCDSAWKLFCNWPSYRKPAREIK